MPKLSQSKAQRSIEILTTNGQLPQAQAVIAQVGYGPEALSVGATMLQEWLTHRNQSKVLLSAQKKATQAQNKALYAAKKEMSNLTQTARILFSDDEPVLTSLGLLTQYESVAVEEDATGEARTQSVAKRLSRSTADMIDRWRLLVTNAQALGEVDKMLLANASWTAERLTAAETLVEAYATADTQQQQAVQAYKTQSALANEALQNMRKWYSRASRLIKLAIKTSDAERREKLEDLLGLT